MKTNHKKNENSDFEAIETLLQAIRNDPVINKKVIGMLEMDSYPRRIILSNWLEELRLNNAPKKLLQTLSYMFDDTIAERVYGLINKSMDYKDNHRYN